MTNQQAAGGSDISRDPREDANADDEVEPGFVDTVRERSLAGQDVEPEDVHHPDNDGETVPGG